MLFLLSTFLKPVVRLGLDSGFFRIYYDLQEEERPRFAGTMALFAAAVASSVFALAWIFSKEISWALFENAEGVGWVRLVAADTLASSFVFVPFALFRIEGRASLLSTFSVIRHAANTVLKVILVLQGHGVAGVLIADLSASLLLAFLLLFELRTRARAALDWPPLREALRFGLPKVPHSLLVQILNLADRRILAGYVSLGEIGVYSVGNNFGGAMKFPLSAFEPAWQPFVLENARKESGPGQIAAIASRMAIVFVVAAVGLALILPDVLIFMSREVAYHAAAPVVPVIVLAFLFQGFFLLSSIGITITKEARFYPMITAAAAAMNIVLNFELIPFFGIMGSAWATVAGYALMAFLGAFISNRLYPIPIHWRRVASAFGAGLACFALGSLGGYGLPFAITRAGLALAFAVFVWRAILDETDRFELRKAVRA